MNIHIYKISNTEYIKINSQCIDKNECETCAEIDIDYVDEKNNIYIRFGNESARSFYYYMVESGTFQKLINNETVLKNSINNDPGLEWNQYYKGLIKDSYVIEKYHFQSNTHKQIRPYFNSWLYNDENGNIIFEITPFYPWHNVTQKTHPEKISYKQWIKNYKPVVKTIIPKENLKQWIKQADEFGKKYKVKFE
ncbi:MAG: hypothetical protein M1365_00115 [Actinobacteria bacterium]|nr:hypothetical protein [Actinomycetota bacterium]